MSKDEAFARLKGEVQKRILTAMEEMRKRHREDLEGLKKCEHRLEKLKRVERHVETVVPTVA